MGRAELGFWATHVEAHVPEEGFWLLGARRDGGVAKRLEGYDAEKATRELYVEIPVVNPQATEFYAFLEPDRQALRRGGASPSCQGRVCSAPEAMRSRSTRRNGRPRRSSPPR